MPVDVRRFPWLRRLAADYAFDFAALAPFFAGDPREPRDWAAAISRAQKHPRRREAIAEILAAQQRKRGASPRAVASAARLVDPRAVALVTGQQAGLFGGPMFTILKALTALKLADQISKEHNVPAVPIFWIEGEDHDWDEVRSVTIFDAQLEPCTVSLPPRSSPEPIPVAHVTLDPAVHDVISQLAEALPPTEFTSSIVAQLREAYSPGTGMADAFGRWLERLLGDRGLVVYDASDPVAKPLAAAVFERELRTPGQTARLAASSGSRLEERGYHAQVRPQDDSLALFRVDGGRRVIRQQDGQLMVGDVSFAPEALLQELNDRPARFSPSVLLRPVVQDTLFPTVCYVSGPNELGYLGQLRDVYEHFGVPMPLMYPRATATVLDSASIRFLTKYQLPLEALQAQDESALNALLKAQIPPIVDETLAGASRTIDAEMTKVIEKVPIIDPTLEATARSTLGRMQHDLRTLHGKLIQAAKRRDETLRRQFMRTRALAFPQGHAQERAIAVVSFLNLYGPALVERLLEELPLDIGHHWVVTI